MRDVFVFLAVMLSASTASAQPASGVFGEMRVLDASGAPRQTARALVLLVREALRYADSIGVRRVETEAPPRLRAFAARMCGLAHDNGVFAGDLQDVRSHNLRVTDANGNEQAS